MSKSGHLLTTAVLAYAVYTHDHNTALAGGILLGSSLPDVGEGVLGYVMGQRLSLLPHRTITHWLPLYLVAWVAIVALSPTLPWWESALMRGLCIGSVFHVVLDSFTPMGVPLLRPFGRRVSFGPVRANGQRWLYRTGSLEEVPVIAAVTVPMLLVLARPQFLPHMHMFR